MGKIKSNSILHWKAAHGIWNRIENVYIVLLFFYSFSLLYSNSVHFKTFFFYNSLCVCDQSTQWKLLNRFVCILVCSSSTFCSIRIKKYAVLYNFPQLQWFPLLIKLFTLSPLLLRLSTSPTFLFFIFIVVVGNVFFVSILFNPLISFSFHCGRSQNNSVFWIN